MSAYKMTFGIKNKFRLFKFRIKTTKKTGKSFQPRCVWIRLCDHFGVTPANMTWMVTISYSRSESFRLCLAGCCQYDVIQYDIITVATLPRTAVVLYATI